MSDRTALPASWHLRQPFRSADGMIYAHDETEAEEAGRVAAEVAADFRRITAREASQRLLVIVGSRDWLKEADPNYRLRLAAKGDANLHGEPEPTDAELSRECKRTRKEAADAGLDLQTVLVMRPDALTADSLVKDLALPPSAGAAFDWAIVIATNEELAAAVHKMVGAAITKEQPSFAKRMLLAPLLPWVRGKAVDAARNGFKRVLFEAHAAGQPDWTPAERKRQVDAYQELLGIELKNGAPPPTGVSDTPPPRTSGS